MGSVIGYFNAFIGGRAVKIGIVATTLAATFLGS